MGGALASVSKFKLGVVAAGAAVAALGIAMAVKSVKSAADFQQAMARVKAISGAVGKEFKSLEDKAKELGKATKFTMVEIAAGMEVLARAGFEVNEIISAMAGVTALASSQAITLAEAGKMVATALRGMGLDITETERAVNLFAATASSAALNVHELSDAFKMIAPVADILGISIEQVAAMIAAIGQVGIVGTRATASLRTAFIRIADPIEDAQEWLDRLNIALWDTQGNFVGLGPMIGQMEKAFQKLGRQEQLAAIGAIFNIRSSVQLLALIKKGEEDFNKYVTSITNTTKAYEQQRIMLDTLSSRWTILQSSIDLLFLTLGTPSLKTLSTLTTAMTDVVNTVTEWKEAMQAANKTIEEMDEEVVSLNDRMLEYTGGMINLKSIVVGSLNAIKLVWDVTFGYLKLHLKEVVSLFVVMIKLLKGDWKGAWDGAMQLLGAWADYFTTIFKDLEVTFKGWIDRVGKHLESFVNTFVAQINRLISLLNMIGLDIPKMTLLGEPWIKGIESEIARGLAGLPGISLPSIAGLPTGAETLAGLRMFDEGLSFATPTVNRFVKTVEEVTEVEKELTETVTDLTSSWLNLRTVVSRLPGLMGQVATGLVDLAQGIIAGDISGIITSIFNMITAWIQDQIREQEERLRELRDIQSFYVSTFRQIGSMIRGAVSGFLGPIGTVLGGAIQLLASSIDMLRLEGIDLLRAGMTSLVSFVSTLIGTFSDLIQRSDAYGALQQESESIWKALGDVLGQFLWPLVAAIKYLKEWLGIQDDVNEQMLEIGVPTAWKRERRAFEAAAPGQVLVGGVQVPSWAEVIGVKLGETIKNVLEGFGISSWTELLAGVRDGAVRLWNWVIGNLPTWIKNVVTFLGNVWGAVTAIYNWVKENLKDMDLGSVWGKFTTVLDNLPSWDNVVSEIDKVIASIDDLKDTLKRVIFMAAGAIVGGIGGALTPLTFGLSAAGAAAGALIGTGLGAVLAGSFQHGGIVPGVIGSPQLAMVHGGERITPPGQGQTIINEITVWIGGREATDVFIETVQRRGKSATGHRSTAAALTRRY